MIAVGVQSMFIGFIMSIVKVKAIRKCMEIDDESIRNRGWRSARS